MQLSTYLFFNGNCEAAFKFYEKVLGGKIEALLKYNGSPCDGQIPPEWNDKIMHAALIIKGQVLMASDCPPDKFQKPGGFYVSVRVDDLKEAERIFIDLAEKGEVRMPFQQTFFAKGFGMLVDQYGTPWMVNCM